MNRVEINAESEAYNTGYEAAIQGAPKSANPYGPDTYDHAQWDAGWDDGRDDIERKDKR